MAVAAETRNLHQGEKRKQKTKRKRKKAEENPDWKKKN